MTSSLRTATMTGDAPTTRPSNRSHITVPTHQHNNHGIQTRRHRAATHGLINTAHTWYTTSVAGPHLLHLHLTHHPHHHLTHPPPTPHLPLQHHPPPPPKRTPTPTHLHPTLNPLQLLRPHLLHLFPLPAPHPNRRARALRAPLHRNHPGLEKHPRLFGTGRFFLIGGGI